LAVALDPTPPWLALDLVTTVAPPVFARNSMLAAQLLPELVLDLVAVAPPVRDSGQALEQTLQESWRRKCRRHKATLPSFVRFAGGQIS